MVFGFATLPVVMGLYTLEALVRGYVDTAVHTVPLEMVGHRRDLLDRINSRYEVAFEVGAVAGPLMLGGRWRQELTPLDHAGGVTAASEFGRTAVSVGVNSAVGSAFSSGASVYGAFGIVGGMLGVFAVAQLALARLYARKGDPKL